MVSITLQCKEGREQEIRAQCQRVVEELRGPLTFRAFKKRPDVILAGSRLWHGSLSFLVHVDESVELARIKEPLTDLIDALQDLDGVTGCGFQLTGGEVKFVGVQMIDGMKFVG